MFVGIKIRLKKREIKVFFLLFLALSILLYFFGCAGNPELKVLKTKVRTQTDSLKIVDKKGYEEFLLLKAAGATLSELDSYSNLKLSSPERENLAKGFWNKKVENLSSQEQAIFYSIYLPSVQKDYLSHTTSRQREKCYQNYLKRLEESLTFAQKDTLVFLTYISSKKEALEWLKRPPSQRELWLNNFWQSRNPDPTNPYNHFKYAMESRWQECESRGYFTQGHLDVRGEIWLKKGKPIQEVSGEAGQAKYNANPTNRISSDPLDARFVAPKEENVMQWIYSDGSCFQFQYENSGWKRVPCQINFSDPLGGLPTSTPEDRIIFDGLSKSVSEIQEALTQPAEYSFDYGGNPFKNITYKIYKLRNEDGTADLILTYGIPLKELEQKGDSLSYFRRISLWNKKDGQFLPIDSATVVLSALSISYLDLLTEKIHKKLSAGEYSLALLFKDNFSGRVGVYKDTSILVVPFVHKDSIEVNELVLTPLITNFDENHPGYQRHGFFIQFLPHNLIKGNSLCCYTEASNLTIKQGFSLYSITYYYKEEKEKDWKESPIAYLPEEKAVSSSVALSRCFDITNLAAGKYLLMAEITDLNSPQSRKKQVVGEFNRAVPEKSVNPVESGD